MHGLLHFAARSARTCLARAVRTRAAARAWTAAEDARLRAAVRASSPPRATPGAGAAADASAVSWAAVAESVPRRDARACRQRWTQSLDAEVRRGAWERAELRALADLARAHAPDYARIAHLLPTRRTAAQVRERLTEGGRSGRAWTPVEDERLRVAVARLGRRWVDVAKAVPGRTDAQCLERWSISADPRLRKGRWTQQEDRDLSRVVRALQGTGEPFHFGDVARLLRGERSRKACRARWRILQRQMEGEQTEQK